MGRLQDEIIFLLIEIMRDKYTNDPYTYHIYGRGYYNWILHWLRGKEQIRRALQELEKIIKQGAELYPSNKRLKELKDIIFKAILITAVNQEDVTYPVLYSEFEL